MITAHIYRTGKKPTDYYISKLVTLPKNAKTFKCEEYRTLTLKQLCKTDYNRTPEAGRDQYGFMKDRGTREAILALMILIDRRLDIGLNTYIVFLDLKKAFDKVI